jgi:uncharacterized protein YhhL (DUF1145 family)
MSVPKFVVLITWIGSLAAMLLGGDTLFATLGKYIFGFLVVAHLIECILFRKELEKIGGSLGKHLLQVFLFGIIHLKEVRRAHKTESSKA